MTGKLIQLNISRGGMPKKPISSARVMVDGIEGDWQKNRKYHAGPDRAICLFSQELLEQLAKEGVELFPGAVGENFTTHGIDLTRLEPGDRFRIGEDAVIELTEIRTPCRNLNKWHPQLLKLIQGRSGWVAKVIEEGIVATGDDIELIGAPLM